MLSVHYINTQRDIHIHPDYLGDWTDGTDIAIVRLPPTLQKEYDDGNLFTSMTNLTDEKCLCDYSRDFAHAITGIPVEAEDNSFYLCNFKTIFTAFLITHECTFSVV